MSILAVIPARYNSTRLPGKAIVDIADKPMIQWVWEAVTASHAIDTVFLATDDDRIRKVAVDFGANVVMTSADCASGTERVCEVIGQIPHAEQNEWVINIQGDEPLIEPPILDKFVYSLENTEAPMATIIAECENTEISDPATVKVVIDRNSNALYFSRSAIPHFTGDIPPRLYKHIGIYAYRPGFLTEFRRLQPSPLELAEKLEQLRALENGYDIHCINIPETKKLIGVDTEPDLEKIRSILQNPGAEHDPHN